MLNKIKSLSLLSVLSTAFISTTVYAQDGAFDAFVDNIGDTGGGVGRIISIIAYTLAGIMFLIAGWNMYKKSKNPNGNEGAIILGAIIAGSVLLAIPTIANIGQDGLFGDENPADNLRFGE